MGKQNSLLCTGVRRATGFQSSGYSFLIQSKNIKRFHKGCITYRYIHFIAQNSDSCSMTSAVHAMLMCSFLYHKDDEVVDELHYEIKKIEGRQPAWEDDADDEERYLNLLPMNCVAPLLLNTDMPASNQDMILTVIITNIIIINIIIIIINMINYN